MEPLINLQEDEDAQFAQFVNTYHKVFHDEWVEKLQRNCDPSSDAGGWFAQFRALQLMRVFLQILPPKTNRQIICTTVTILSQPPGSQGVSHGSWKSAALTRAHILFDGEAYNIDFNKRPTTDANDESCGDQIICSPSKRQKVTKKYFTEKYQGLPVAKKLGVLERERQNISPLLEEKEAALTVMALGNGFMNEVALTKSKCIKCSHLIISKFHCTNPMCGDVTSEVDNLEEGFDGELLLLNSQETCATQDTFIGKADKVEFTNDTEYKWTGSQQADYIFDSQQSQG
jgi:hypothetical protein